MTTPFFAEELDSGSRCSGGHPLMLVAEGYAYCCPEAPLGIPTMYCADLPFDEERERARLMPV